MAQIDVGGRRFEVETFGAARDPAVLLVMGLGMQLLGWPEALCRRIAEAGYHVIRFDNRDIGLSHKHDGERVYVARSALRWFMRLPLAAPYRIEDMAQDARGVLDALAVPKAHVVGASMGGMIAQNLAAGAPDRCLSLSSIMSSSGDRSLPLPHARVLKMLLTPPPAGASFERRLRHFVRLFQSLGGPGFPSPEAELRERMRISLERSYSPAGTLRQLVAIAASGDRSARLGTIRVPTLVLHGDADPLLPLPHGRDCARKIPGARLSIIPGMGHDIPPALVPRLGDELLAFFAQSNSAAAPATS